MELNLLECCRSRGCLIRWWIDVVVKGEDEARYRLLNNLQTLYLVVEISRLLDSFTNSHPDIVLRMTAPLLRRI